MRVDIKIQSAGWEVRAHGNRSKGITSMAVAPTQPVTGVAEAGKFSRNGEDLASRGLSLQMSTIDDLDLDQLNSLLKVKVRLQKYRHKIANENACTFFSWNFRFEHHVFFTTAVGLISSTRSQEIAPERVLPGVVLK